MRRKDREMDREFAYSLIDKASFGTLSLRDEDKPYGIPLSLVREGDNLYFHSAKQGKKVELLAHNPYVSVTFVGDTNIPELFSQEELEEMARDESKAAVLISNVFTTEFASAIVTGRAQLVAEEAERVKAIKLICEKYTPTKMAYFAMALKSGLKRMNLYKIQIDEVTAKRKKYDEQGKEIKAI